jgi:hypothetical protein
MLTSIFGNVKVVHQVAINESSPAKGFTEPNSKGDLFL